MTFLSSRAVQPLCHLYGVFFPMLEDNSPEYLLRAFDGSLSSEGIVPALTTVF